MRRIVVGVAVYHLPSHFTILKDNSEFCYALKKPLAEGKFVSPRFQAVSQYKMAISLDHGLAKTSKKACS